MEQGVEDRARALDESAVRHVAGLARLNITDAEATAYATQLSRILDYVAQLNELDPSDVPPTAHPLPVSNVFREDEVQPSWTPGDALRNAPGHDRDYFQVPKVLDQEGA